MVHCMSCDVRTPNKCYEVGLHDKSMLCGCGITRKKEKTNVWSIVTSNNLTWENYRTLCCRINLF